MRKKIYLLLGLVALYSTIPYSDPAMASQRAPQTLAEAQARARATRARALQQQFQQQQFQQRQLQRQQVAAAEARARRQQFPRSSHPWYPNINATCQAYNRITSPNQINQSNYGNAIAACRAQPLSNFLKAACKKAFTGNLLLMEQDPNLQQCLQQAKAQNLRTQKIGGGYIRFIPQPVTGKVPPAQTQPPAKSPPNQPAAAKAPITQKPNILGKVATGAIKAMTENPVCKTFTPTNLNQTTYRQAIQTCKHPLNARLITDFLRAACSKALKEGFILSSQDPYTGHCIEQARAQHLRILRKGELIKIASPRQHPSVQPSRPPSSPLKPVSTRTTSEGYCDKVIQTVLRRGTFLIQRASPHLGVCVRKAREKGLGIASLGNTMIKIHTKAIQLPAPQPKSEARPQADMTACLSAINDGAILVFTAPKVNDCIHMASQKGLTAEIVEGGIKFIHSTEQSTTQEETEPSAPQPKPMPVQPKEEKFGHQETKQHDGYRIEKAPVYPKAPWIPQFTWINPPPVGMRMSYGGFPTPISANIPMTYGQAYSHFPYGPQQQNYRVPFDPAHLEGEEPVEKGMSSFHAIVPNPPTPFTPSFAHQSFGSFGNIVGGAGLASPAAMVNQLTAGFGQHH